MSDIDKVPAEKKAAFQRVPVYCYAGYQSSGLMVKGEITSIAESRAYSSAQADVLTVIRLHGPISDERIVRIYQATSYLGIQSESGIRTRRSELVRLGLVVDSGLRGRTASNRQTVLWKVAK